MSGGTKGYWKQNFDTKITYENNQIKTKLHKIQRYKRDALNADLNREEQIATYYLNADYPQRFINSVIRQRNVMISPKIIQLHLQIFLVCINH